MASSSSSSASPMDAKKTVDDAVVQYPVLVFSKTYCPYCTRAKNALAEAGAKDVKVFELDKMGPAGTSIQRYISEKYRHSTVPSVFIGGEFIGGGDETAGLQRAGKLAAKVSAAASK